jgi:hypothetical protein
MTTADGHTVLIGPNDKRLRSHDMRWHICINRDFDAQDDAQNRVRCIFEPPDS